jgi:hypothetical protein
MKTIIALFKKLNPYDHFAVFLTILSIFLIGTQGKSDAVHLTIHLALILIVLVVLDFGFSRLTHQKHGWVSNLISGFILFLILDHSATGVLGALTILFAVTTCKHVVRYRGTRLFNPVAFSVCIGAVIGFVFPHINVPVLSWDGLLTEIELNLIVFKVGFFFVILSMFTNSVRRLKKFASISSFLVVVLAGTWLGSFFTGALDVLAVMGSPIVYFVAGALLIEPKTSPVRPNEQLVFGTVAAIAYTLFLALQLPVGPLLAILSANIVFRTLEGIRQ